MNEIWHKALASMTRGADTREVVVKSLGLALCCVLFTIPYFHYLLFSTSAIGRLPRGLGPWGLLCTQLFLLFIVCLLSAMVGLSFSKRLELPGFGDRRRFVRSIPGLILAGVVLISVSYFLFDRHFMKISPRSYPADMLYVVSFPLKGAFADEIILRLCLVTLTVGLFGRKDAGVIVVAALAPLFTMKYLDFIGQFALGSLFIRQFFFSFVANLLLGYLFVTYGLLYSMALRFLLGMKYMVIAWTVG